MTAIHPETILFTTVIAMLIASAGIGWLRSKWARS